MRLVEKNCDYTKITRMLEETANVRIAKFLKVYEIIEVDCWP